MIKEVVKIQQAIGSQHGFCVVECKDDIDKALKNQRNAEDVFQITNKKVCFMKQTHSNEIFEINDVSFAENINIIQNVDGLFTREKGVTLIAHTSDCVPVIISNKNKDFVAVIHSGRKGSINGINEKMISKIAEYFPINQDIYVGIGPCIHSESYEVGKDVFDEFVGKNEKFSEFFVKNENNRYKFNLKDFVKSIYFKAGVSVFDINIDTYSNETFHSYRRNTLKPYIGYMNFPSFVVL